MGVLYLIRYLLVKPHPLLAYSLLDPTFLVLQVPMDRLTLPYREELDHIFTIGVMERLPKI